jgi:hypothetical protein
MEANNVLLLAVAVVTLVNTMISARNHAKITEAKDQVAGLSVQVDGRLTQLLAATARFNKAVGIEQGKAEVKAEIAANENSQSTL